MKLYASADIDDCRQQNHQFQFTSSDKKPLKMSMLCVTCTERSHVSTYVGYGDETKSFGTWRRKREAE